MIVIQILEWLTSFLGGAFDFNVDLGALVSTVTSVLDFVAWVIPLDTVLLLFGISLFLIQFRIVVAIWKLLPLT